MSFFRRRKNLLRDLSISRRSHAVKVRSQVKSIPEREESKPCAGCFVTYHLTPLPLCTGVVQTDDEIQGEAAVVFNDSSLQFTAIRAASVLPFRRELQALFWYQGIVCRNDCHSLEFSFGHVLYSGLASFCQGG
ncbi:hypothetical protein JTE90_026584 [Oedothorax gibbosus]|uniref:Uncharacterized protein n=1 Tax=Oedothorax gibbosus TaxID=931172 RepID=A0AAV6U068_9ARAC|nr:hypothetical protein JTE90_026584 [Oedothorax gibbosus]